MDITIISILIAVLAVITVVILWYRQSTIKWSAPTSSKYNRVLIYGPSGSGKTLLFFQLFDGRNHETQSSMKENVLIFQPKQGSVSKKYEFIDLTGNVSQSYRLIKYCKNIKYVIFLIDSTDSQNIIHSSQLLYKLLIKKEFNDIKPSPKILICGNKNEQPNATSIISIKSTLIKELNKLNQSKSSLSSIDDDDDNQQSNINLVDKNKTSFSWDDLNYDITFATCSVLQKRIEPIIDFLK